MKNLFYFVLFLFSSSLIISCQKDEENKVKSNLSTDEIQVAKSFGKFLYEEMVKDLDSYQDRSGFSVTKFKESVEKMSEGLNITESDLKNDVGFISIDEENLFLAFNTDWQSSETTNVDKFEESISELKISKEYKLYLTVKTSFYQEILSNKNVLESKLKIENSSRDFWDCFVLFFEAQYYIHLCNWDVFGEPAAEAYKAFNDGKITFEEFVKILEKVIKIPENYESSKNCLKSVQLVLKFWNDCLFPTTPLCTTLECRQKNCENQGCTWNTETSSCNCSEDVLCVKRGCEWDGRNCNCGDDEAIRECESDPSCNWNYDLRICQCK